MAYAIPALRHIADVATRLADNETDLNISGWRTEDVANIVRQGRLYSYTPWRKLAYVVG